MLITENSGQKTRTACYRFRATFWAFNVDEMFSGSQQGKVIAGKRFLGTALPGVRAEITGERQLLVPRPLLGP